MASFVNPDGKTGVDRVYGCPSSDEAGDGKTWRECAIKRVALLAAFARNETCYKRDRRLIIRFRNASEIRRDIINGFRLG